jgi:hypothetical protein
MIKHKNVFSIFILLAMLVPVGMALAKDKEPVGSPINVLTGTPTVFESGTPFHIEHGWADENGPQGIYDFELYVDGVLHKEDFILRDRVAGRGGTFTMRWVHNFPDGMVGLHTFVGRWYGPCTHVVADPSLCTSRNARTLEGESTLTVVFGEP